MWECIYSARALLHMVTCTYVPMCGPEENISSPPLLYSSLLPWGSVLAEPKTKLAATDLQQSPCFFPFPMLRLQTETWNIYMTTFCFYTKTLASEFRFSCLLSRYSDWTISVALVSCLLSSKATLQFLLCGNGMQCARYLSVNYSGGCLAELPVYSIIAAVPKVSEVFLAFWTLRFLKSNKKMYKK